MNTTSKARFLGVIAIFLVGCSNQTASATAVETAASTATLIPSTETPSPTPTIWYEISYPKISLENHSSLTLIKSLQIPNGIDLFNPNFIWFYPNSVEYQKIIIQSADIPNYSNWRTNSVIDIKAGTAVSSPNLISPNGKLEATNLRDPILEPEIFIMNKDVRLP